MMVIAAQGLAKSYGAVAALRGASFDIAPREIVGFAGDNGAGKSTLMKIVAGDLQPTGGELRVTGDVRNSMTPRQARALGIEMVYQDLALCDNLSIYENIFLGREITRFRAGPLSPIAHVKMIRRAEQLLDQLGVKLNSLTAPVSALSGGQRQFVAIARALAGSPKLVIMDEPTAALSVGAGKPLLELIRRLPETGTAVMLVSHRLSDLLETTSRIYVLRRGEIATELRTPDTSETRLLHAMAGIG